MEELKYYLQNGFIHEKLVTGPIAKARSLEKAKLIINALNNSPAVSEPDPYNYELPVLKATEPQWPENWKCSNHGEAWSSNDNYPRGCRECHEAFVANKMKSEMIQAWQDAQEKT